MHLGLPPRHCSESSFAKLRHDFIASKRRGTRKMQPAISATAAFELAWLYEYDAGRALP
jgi:hypothetical protein